MVMLLHDPSDVFLEGAKICNYAEWEGPSTALFAALLVSWLGLRLIVLPFWVVRSCLYAPMPLHPVWKLDTYSELCSHAILTCMQE